MISIFNKIQIIFNLSAVVMSSGVTKGPGPLSDPRMREYTCETKDRYQYLYTVITFSTLSSTLNILHIFSERAKIFGHSSRLRMCWLRVLALQTMLEAAFRIPLSNL